MADAPLLDVDGVCVDRGVLRVVDEVSLQVPAGACVGMLGLNGAGKSSFMAALAGLLPVASGAIRLDGEAIHQAQPWDRAKRGLSLVPSGRQLWPGISVEDTLRVGAHLVHSKAEVLGGLEAVYGHFPILREKRRQRAQELSGGQQQMLAIGRALMARPKVLLLDEPSEGLAPVVVDQVFDVIAKLREEEGLTILLAEQNAGMVDICDTVMVMRDGRLGPIDVESDTVDVEGVVFES